jgi:hypothetical protein
VYLNYKLYFKYIFFFTNQFFLKFLIKNDKNTVTAISQNNLYYLSLHLKLSSLFYSTQLVDIFAYEIPLNKNILNNDKHSGIKISSIEKSILVYNFHSILFNQRFFVFVLNSLKKDFNKNSTQKTSLTSISEIFVNAN